MPSLLKLGKEQDVLRVIEDPVLFAEVMLGHEVWSKQRQILQSVATRSRTAVKACHSSSKTFTAAEAVLWWITSHEEAIAVTTAPTWTQVERLLWGEIRNAVYRSKIRYPKPTSSSLQLGPGRYAIGLSTNEGVRFQGFHGNVLVVGEDETVLCVRRGPRIVLLRAWAARDPRGDVIAALLPFKGRVETVNVDSVGIGFYMAQHLKDHGSPVQEVNVGERPRDTEKYYNLKGELYWGLRQRAQDGDLAGLTDERTIAQLAGLRYSHNSRGQIVIESKEDARKRGVKSPDRAEAVMMAFAERRCAYGLIEYLQSEQERINQQQAAKTTLPLSLVKATPDGNRPCCSQCGSFLLVRLNRCWRCNQCGMQFWDQDVVPKLLSRREALGAFDERGR
jgi:hypothetical protein